MGCQRPEQSPPTAATPGGACPLSFFEPTAALDGKVFGADRRRVLTELLGFAERVLVAQDGRGHWPVSRRHGATRVTS
jgi:hypothetical protein